MIYTIAHHRYLHCIAFLQTLMTFHIQLNAASIENAFICVSFHYPSLMQFNDQKEI